MASRRLTRFATNTDAVMKASVEQLKASRAQFKRLPSALQSIVLSLQRLAKPKNTVMRIKFFAGVVAACAALWGASNWWSKRRAAAKKSKNEERKRKRRRRVAVDGVFVKRLIKIFKIVFPTWKSNGVFAFVMLTVLLFARTILSILMAEILGANAQNLVGRRWLGMWRGMKLYGWLVWPAAATNAGLKYFTAILALHFRVALSRHVHDVYLDGVNFYKACNLGAGSIDHADQRVTADIAKFSDEIASLYTSVFKPVLDVVLFTYSLGQILGWQGPAWMHLYFVLSGIIKKKIMPSLGWLVAQESELEGAYRTAHQRLITNSEEIAFYDGSHKEKGIINSLLDRIARHVRRSRYTRMLLNIFDNLLVKYYATVAGYLTLLSPLLFNLEHARTKSSEELTRDYIRNSQYLQNLSLAIGNLVEVGTKLTSIAGYTTRVSELLESVHHLNDQGNTPFEVRDEEPTEEELKAALGDQADEDEESKASRNDGSLAEWIQHWKQTCDEQKEARLRIRRRMSGKTAEVVGGGTYELSEDIQFEGVDIVSPEGKLLVRDLNFTVAAGRNVMVTGPNGVGKSSLFRVIGELWPLHCGVLRKPLKEDILFVPQKPYLVLGTLRDQIIYPHSVDDMKELGITDDDLRRLLHIVDPADRILKEWDFDTEKDWFHAFSGGQKQRVAMARLFYHRPSYSILDECTSAVSDEVEDQIYDTCKRMGITIFTVSHRPNLARHHHIVLRFCGKGEWKAFTTELGKKENVKIEQTEGGKAPTPVSDK